MSTFIAKVSAYRRAARRAAALVVLEDALLGAVSDWPFFEPAAKPCHWLHGRASFGAVDLVTCAGATAGGCAAGASGIRARLLLRGPQPQLMGFRGYTREPTQPHSLNDTP